MLQLAGVSLGFGTRLNWPDDYFQFQAQLAYRWYYLKNWDYLYLHAQRYIELSHSWSDVVTHINRQPDLYTPRLAVLRRPDNDSSGITLRQTQLGEII